MSYPFPSCDSVLVFLRKVGPGFALFLFSRTGPGAVKWNPSCLRLAERDLILHKFRGCQITTLQVFLGTRTTLCAVSNIRRAVERYPDCGGNGKRGRIKECKTLTFINIETTTNPFGLFAASVTFVYNSWL